MKSMANRYKLTWTEWVSTHNPEKPLQIKVISSETSFKTKAEAEEFFEAFKSDVRDIRIVDIVTNRVIRQC